MNSERIFFGDIYKVTEYEIEKEIPEPISNDPKISRIKKKRELLKKQAVLLQTKDQKYLDLEQMNFLLWLRLNYRIPFMEKHLLRTLPLMKDQVYIEQTSLRPYLNFKTDVDLKIVRKRHKSKLTN